MYFQLKNVGLVTVVAIATLSHATPLKALDRAIENYGLLNARASCVSQSDCGKRL